MSLKHYLDLLLVLVLNTILVVVVLFVPLDAIRIILGLPYVLFFPGYTLIAALFTRRGSLDGIERLALCFGLSIAVVPLIGLVLNYTPWGIRLLPSLLALYIFMLAMSVIAFLRRRSLGEEERFCFSISKTQARTVSAWTEGSETAEGFETVERRGSSLVNPYSITGLIILVLLVAGLLIAREAWQIALSIPIVLAAGYCLAGIIFRHEDELTLMVRIFMSLCFSILLGLLTAIAITGISEAMQLQSRFSTVFVILSIVGIVFAAGAALLRYYLANTDYPVYKVTRKTVAGGKVQWLDRLLNVLLVLAILAAVGAMVYAIVTPRTGEKFTEFYILGLEGKAEKYPRQVQLGQEASVILGIVNREHASASYRAVISIDGATVAEYGSIMLEHEGKWEQIVSFKPIKAGENQKVEFLLYKDRAEEVYLTLHIWLDVAL